MSRPGIAVLRKEASRSRQRILVMESSEDRVGAHDVEFSNYRLRRTFIRLSTLRPMEARLDLRFCSTLRPAKNVMTIPARSSPANFGAMSLIRAYQTYDQPPTL